MRTQKSYQPYYWCVKWVDIDGAIQSAGHAHSFGGIVEWAQEHLEELPDSSELKFVNRRVEIDV